MNIDRAGKQQRAAWRSERSYYEKWKKQGLPKEYCQKVAMEEGHAAGWIAGVAWAKRQKKGTP